MEGKNAFRPIWEMELIVSGAIIFGLFQLPVMVNQLYQSVDNHLSIEAFWLPFLSYYFLKLAINMLIGAFLLHFIVRSLWVAILGFQEVFPEKVDVEKTDFGVLQKRIFAERQFEIDVLRKRLDNAASLIFTVLFMFILMIVGVLIYIFVSAFLAWVLGKIGLDYYFSIVFLIILGIIYFCSVLMSVLGTNLDGWFSKDETRITNHPRLAKFTRFCIKVTYYLNLSFIVQPIFVTLRMNMSGRKIAIFSLVIFSAVFIPFFIGVKMEISNFDSYIYMPCKSTPKLMMTACYDNLRKSGDDLESPSIQADVIEADAGPIKLFLPFLIRRHNALVDELCPELDKFHNDGVYQAKKIKVDDQARYDKAVQQSLDCMKKLFQISLDGSPIKTNMIFFSHHPITEKGGIKIYIPTESLDTGEHIITVSMKKKKLKEVAEIVTYIPFLLQK